MSGPRAAALTLLCLAVLAPPAPAAARDGGTLSDRQPRIRTTDRRLASLLEEGARASTTFRALVDHLARSDVVVYLRCDRSPEPQRLDGRLTFLSTAGGFRYVVIRLNWLTARRRQLAILAHELQHAVEVADRPAIVDGPSLAREYARIGYVNRGSATPGLSFDTHAAVATGERVLREIAGASGD
jgi:hypothetical protein